MDFFESKLKKELVLVLEELKELRSEIHKLNLRLTSLEGRLDERRLWEAGSLEKESKEFNG